ncbi:MAG: hypothetical protein IT176_07490 [Acidobacteria bacterium]|nr:hypothetical protein [Acidobacteriota bacterium]
MPMTGVIRARAPGLEALGAPPQPPAFGGDDLSRIGVVLTAHGLRPFAEEYDDSSEREIEGVRLRVLPLERVLASKRATGRPKDAASLPVLEATLRAKASPPGDG